MGSRSDVAKNAADMILLDDSFCSIVGSFESGRIICNNLKKSIAHALQANIPELIPFDTFIHILNPSTSFYCIDFAYRCKLRYHASCFFCIRKYGIDIMKRKPRNSNIDNLFNTKMNI